MLTGRGHLRHQPGHCDQRPSIVFASCKRNDIVLSFPVTGQGEVLAFQEQTTMFCSKSQGLVGEVETMQAGKPELLCFFMFLAWLGKVGRREESFEKENAHCDRGEIVGYPVDEDRH